MSGEPSKLADEITVPDAVLIERARGRNFGAFEELVTRHEEKVYRLAFRFLRNEAEAREVVQETFLSLWRKLDSFRGDAQFTSWLYRVAANAALMRLRSQRRRPEVSAEDLQADALEVAGADQERIRGDNWAKRPDEQFQSAELRLHIQTAVDALPDGYRTVFLVRDVEGLSTEQTAEVLGLTVQTVKTRLHRARLALRGSISEYFAKN